ncbi:metallopeptidase family protein [Intestinibacillus massiliensis]|uniref:metallopeptidase family protein n=1 Tax=Intestinibacillus massiliensis TaxID=1871029 RepID=UPI001D071292|nr:metallopeptidase family protein [Intestinibacillus massiliensis]MCB6367117.1 metallopeptidase family protein [Intestinibacillus massiliensis]
MVTIDEAHDLLDEVAQELPEEFWEGLNGGVSLLPQSKRSPEARADDLYVLGEYRIDPALGRYINIYYGSFQRLFGDIPPQRLKKKLRKTLFHEFTHHVESLAGERGLEIKDAEQMARYLRSHGEG